MILHKIQQQYYTCGQQGIFRSNEGYDTIAKSPQLDNNFIKKTLHPFCVYDTPRELQERSEKDISLYPESITLFHTESGELVLGRSVYVGADFTGQRNTFFTHNYVIPKLLRDEFIKNPEKIFAVQRFVNTYDIASGKDLEELADIPSGQPLTHQEKRQVLDRLGIDEMNYKQLLFAVMSSISSKKKVYISLDIEVSESSLYAKKLLEIIYDSLPYELRRNFGFITYGNEPQSKKHIHVMFVEKGSIRPNDRNIEKDFLFDFPNKRFVNADLLGDDHEYLNFAWENLQEPNRRREFYDFAEEVLSGSDASKATHISTYYELCALFLVDKGRVHIYQKNKIGILTSLLQLLQDQNLHQKARLHDLIKGLFRQERNDIDSTKNLPLLDCVKLFIDYDRIPKDESINQEMGMFLIKLILRSREAAQSQYVSDLHKHIITHKQLFVRIMNTILNNPPLVPPLFEEYVIHRLESLSKIKDLLEEIKLWSSVSTKAMDNLFFRQTVQKRMKELLGLEQELSTRVGEIYRFCERMGRNVCVEEILETACRSLLKKVDLHTLTREEYAKILPILNGIPNTFITELERESRKKGEVLQKVHRLLDEDERIEPEELFADLTREEIHQTQWLIQQFLRDKLDAKQFNKLIYAFYEEDGFIRFYPILQYVHQQGDFQTILNFVSWSLYQGTFTNRGRKLYTAYRNALRSYFLHEGIELIRNREARNQWRDIKHPDFQKLLDEIRDVTSSGVTRFFRKNLGPIVLGTASVLAVGVISCIVLLFMGKLYPKPVPSTTISTPNETQLPAVHEIPQPVEVPTTPVTGEPSTPDSPKTSTPIPPTNQGRQEKKSQPEQAPIPTTSPTTTKSTKEYKSPRQTKSPGALKKIESQKALPDGRAFSL